MATKEPDWKPEGRLEELVITAEDVLDCMKFYDFFEIPKDPSLVALEMKMKSHGVLTVDDQHMLRTIIAADISKASHSVFRDEVFDGVRIETAQVLTAIVVWETKKVARKAVKAVKTAFKRRK